MGRARDLAEHAGHTYEDQMLSNDYDGDYMHPVNIELDRERTVMITYTDEVEAVRVVRAIPHCITFGRGAWWLEATDVETNVYTRIRMSKIMMFQRAA